MSANPPTIIPFLLAAGCVYAAGSLPSDMQLPNLTSQQIDLGQPVSHQAYAYLTSDQVRTIMGKFSPAPGHSFPVSDVPVPPVRELSPHVRADGSFVTRRLYQAETGLEIALLIENDRVIGYQILPTE